MIGGGVYAYTLLGVSINEEKIENSKLLILDPHYIGADDLTKIIKKGGISWKSKDMF